VLDTPSPVKTPEDIQRGLRPVRWLRSAAIFCLFGPVVLTAAIVLVHKTGLYTMSFLVSGAAWTHRFWNWLFYLFAIGAFLALLNRARVCPRCGKGFFIRSGWNPRQRVKREKGSFARFNVNVFGRRCLNCGLRLDGSNAHEKWEE